MADLSDIGEIVEEMDQIQDCGVSYFDDSNDDSEVVEDVQNRFNHVNEVQRGSPPPCVPESAYALTEDSHASCDAQRNTPSTSHEQDQIRTFISLPTITVVDNLSSGFVRSTSPFTTASFPLQQPPQPRPHKSTSHQQNDSLLIMSRPDLKLTQNAQGLQFEDDEDYQFPPNRSVFQTTEEEEDFLEALEREVGPTLTGGNEGPTPLPQESYDQPFTTRRRVVQQPTITSVKSPSELTEQSETQAQPNSVQTTQGIRQRIEYSTPAPLTASQRPHDGQQTFQSISQAPSTSQHTSPQSYQIAYQRTEPRTQIPSLTPSTRAELRTMAAKIDHSDDPLVQALLVKAPGVDLSEPRLTDRCRGMEYIPFRTAEDLSRIHSDHVRVMQEVMSRLRAAIARRTSSSQAPPLATDSKITTIENFLYVKAVHVLRSHFSTHDRCFIDLGTLNRGTAQLTVLHRLLQHVDLTIRPNGPVHVKNSMDAWYVAAIKWQREIHEDWINELDTGKKRKAPDDNDDDYGDDDGDGKPSKKAHKDDSKKADDKPARRPGRPPGSLNKSTIAARQKQAAKAKEKEQRKQGQKSSLPQLTKEEVRLAQESAAKYARYQDGPGPAALTTPRMTAAASTPRPPPFQAQAQAYGQGQYQSRPQTQQSQLRSGYLPQFTSQTVQGVPNSFLNPFNTASMQQSSQPNFPQHQLQPQPQSGSQFLNPYSNLAQAHLQPAIHPSLLNPHGSTQTAPPPPPPHPRSTQRHTYPNPLQLFPTQMTPPPPSTTTTMTNPTTAAYTFPPVTPQRPWNNNNDNDDDLGNDGGGEFTDSQWSGPDFR